jgi:hypothetical protein
VPRMRDLRRQTLVPPCHDKIVESVYRNSSLHSPSSSFDKSSDKFIVFNVRGRLCGWRRQLLRGRSRLLLRLSRRGMHRLYIHGRCLRSESIGGCCRGIRCRPDGACLSQRCIDPCGHPREDTPFDEMEEKQKMKPDDLN